MTQIQNMNKKISTCLVCGNAEYYLSNEGGYLVLHSIKSGIRQGIAVIHDSTNITVLCDNSNNKISIKGD